MARNIQSDEKQGPTKEIILPNNAVIQNLKYMYGTCQRRKSLKEFITTKAVLYEMLKGPPEEVEEKKIKNTDNKSHNKYISVNN